MCIRDSIKSEAFNGQQRDLFAEDWQVDDTDLQQHLEQLSSTSKVPRVRAGRQALAAHLPRIEVRHEPASCTCEQCGQALKLIRDEVVEKLDNGILSALYEMRLSWEKVPAHL